MLRILLFGQSTRTEPFVQDKEMVFLSSRVISRLRVVTKRLLLEATRRKLALMKVLAKRGKEAYTVAIF